MISIKIINDYNKSLKFKINKVKQIPKNIFINENQNNAKILIILSNREYVSNLKKTYFKVSQFTDVIAFNLEDENSPIDGEIYISIDDVKENSEIFSNSFNNEFTRVLIHGALHLCGYDDIANKDKKIMKKLEEKYLLNFDEEIITLKC